MKNTFHKIYFQIYAEPKGVGRKVQKRTFTKYEELLLLLSVILADLAKNRFIIQISLFFIHYSVAL